MAVAEFDFDGVVADEVPGEDLYVFKIFWLMAAVLGAEDVFFADVFGAGGVGSEIGGIKIAFRKVVP